MTDYEAERYEGNGGADFENQSYGAGGADSSPPPRGADDHSDSKSEV
jgi:splicing factor U2AF subunit